MALKQPLILAFLLLAIPAHAQEPSEAMKKAALMRAYELNGNSMVRWGTIDLSAAVSASAEDAPVRCYEQRGDATGQAYFECPEPIKTIRIIPTDKPAPKPLPAPAKRLAETESPPAQSNVCSRHGLRKVVHGRSWNCRR